MLTIVNERKGIRSQRCEDHRSVKERKERKTEKRREDGRNMYGIHPTQLHGGYIT